MPDIADYTRLVEVLLGEAAKYLPLLLFSVLAIRLWRHVWHTTGEQRQKTLAFAVIITALTVATGYFSIRHSLGRLNLYYGMNAAKSGNLTSALVLFQNSAREWKSADAIGGEGVCLLWLEETNMGVSLLDEAKALRKGENKFEDYYEGLYYFYHNQWEKAIPLLESASTEVVYRWNVTEFIAVIELEKGDIKGADALMKPYEASPMADDTEAYIIASLDFWKGQRAEARVLVEQYDTEKVAPFWKSRFDKLHAELQNPAP